MGEAHVPRVLPAFYLRAINPVTSSTCRFGKRPPHSCISCIYHNYFPRNLPPKKKQGGEQKQKKTPLMMMMKVDECPGP